MHYVFILPLLFGGQQHKATSISILTENDHFSGSRKDLNKLTQSSEELLHSYNIIAATGLLFQMAPGENSW